jgi:osmoprotectant transport system permease protein
VSEPGFFARVVEWFGDANHWIGSSGVPSRLGEHVLLSLAAVLIAMAIALPLGLYIGHTRRFEFLVVSVTNVGRAIPSFGLLFLFVLLFGLGLRYPTWFRPAILIPLVLLAIPPILTNTYVGIQGVDDDTLEAARGMGMTERQVLVRIEVPLGSPLILAGLRTAAVQVVATATLAAVIGGGGLGRFIVDGFSLGQSPTGRAQVFAGAVLVALLAILTEVAFSLVERVATPRTARRDRDLPFRHLGQTGQPAPL